MSETVTLEQAVQQANDLRQRIIAGERPDKEELKQALNALRSGRSAAQSSKKSSAKKEPAKPLDLAALFQTPVGGEENKDAKA